MAETWKAERENKKHPVPVVVRAVRPGRKPVDICRVSSFEGSPAEKAKRVAARAKAIERLPNLISAVRELIRALRAGRMEEPRLAKVERELARVGDPRDMHEFNTED